MLMGKWSGLDFIDENTEIFLPMAGSLVTAFSSAEVRGIKLIALYDGILSGGFERGDDLCAFNVGSAYFDGRTFADKQDFAYLDGFCVRGDVRKLDIERVALADLVLFTALFDYRIHFKHSGILPPNVQLKVRYYSISNVAVKGNFGYF
jgi:hypothetical protein